MLPNICLNVGKIVNNPGCLGYHLILWEINWFSFSLKKLLHISISIIVTQKLCKLGILDHDTTYIEMPEILINQITYL